MNCNQKKVIRRKEEEEICYDGVLLSALASHRVYEHTQKKFSKRKKLSSL